MTVRTMLSDEPPPRDLRGHTTTVTVERLRDLIVQGELKPNVRIPEHEICKRLGLSRTPLREALKLLAAEGLVTIAPNRGAIVTSLTVEDIEAVIQVLTALEGLAAELACSLIEDDELREIRLLHAQMVAHAQADALLDYFHVNQTIHQRIVDAARNRALSRIYRIESARIWRYRYTGNLEHPRWERAIHEHEQILAALELRDGPLLRELMRVHMVAGWHVAREILQQELIQEQATSKPRRRRRVA